MPFPPHWLRRKGIFLVQRFFFSGASHALQTVVSSPVSVSMT